MPKRTGQKGKGIFDFLKKTHNFIRDNKLISTIGSMIPHAGAQKVASVAGALGYGKRRRRPRRTGAGQAGGQNGGFLPLLGLATKLLGGKKRKSKVLV